jgi:hypothetical protein
MITKLLYLLSQGETLGGSEASEVFFGVTKLFQSTDVREPPSPQFAPSPLSPPSHVLVGGWS